MTRIAILQMTSGIEPAANAQTLMRAVERAAEGGAAMLFTPEMSGMLDRDRKRAAESICPESEDVVLAAVRAAAAKAGVWVALGSLAVEREGEVLLDMGGEAAGLGFAELDLGRIADVRGQLPSLANRRAIPRSNER